jgi:hypothetical protein
MPGGVRPVVSVSQYDTGREITLSYDDYMYNSTVEIHGTRADGAGVTQAATMNMNNQTITWTPGEDFTAKPGDVICEAVFTSSGRRTGSANFILRVEPAGKDDAAPMAGSTVTITEPGTYNVAPYDEAIVEGHVVAGTKFITDNGVFDVSDFARVSVDVEGIVPTGTKHITENGTYDVTDFASASVDVEGGSEPTGTKYITENGNYNVRDYANASVNVAGGITPTGTRTITTNGTYDITNYAQAVVNVPATQTGVPLSVLDGETTPGSVDIDLSDANLGVLSGALAGNDTLRTVKVQTREIGQNALADCSYLTRVDLYDVENIGDSAFYADASLNDVYMHISQVPVLGVTVFYSTPIGNGTGTIHCPASLENDLKQATNWSAYASQIVGDL